MITSLEGWPTKTKEAPSTHDVRLTLLDTNPVFLCLGGKLGGLLSRRFIGGSAIEKIQSTIFN